VIFQHTYAMVMDGSKTQTRRLVKPGDDYLSNQRTHVLAPSHAVIFMASLQPVEVISSVYNGKRKVYEVGKTYAVQMGRGKPGSSKRIEITSIRQEDIRNISDEDVMAEGFESKLDFLDTWVRMHDSPMAPLYDTTLRQIPNRPPERYLSWALTFKLVVASK
jgi:hypothetical protein